MQELGMRRQYADLKGLVVEASRALARMDADRLEELAASCQLLNRDLVAEGAERRAEMVRQAREAKGDLAVFARVLEATRANLDVMNRLRELHAGRLDYGERLERRWLRPEGGHGDN